MCGIAGIVTGNGPRERGAAAVERMKQVLIHRGPDGDGTAMLGAEGGLLVALGHRRLSIIDPEGGAQPMKLANAGLTVTFNGAIYNHLELRAVLAGKGHPFHTHSDTEVILHAYREWGEDCVKHFNGMFAFALWDEGQQRLFCARDRVGIKPFYFRATQERFSFASEMKALHVAHDAPPEVNPEGMKDYITFQFTLGAKTMFKGIERLQPGEAMVVDGSPGALRYRRYAYWQPDYTVDEQITEEQAREKLRFLIEDAIRLQLRSDVPVGAYLSGGLDSSAIVGVAARSLEQTRIETFTGAFSEGLEYDETRYARLVADAAKTQHHDIYISGDPFAQTLPRLMYFMDEPAAGPGLYPQYFVSQHAARHVKVALGGQGGDELFVGYARYLVAYLEHALKAAIYPGTEAPGDVPLREIEGSLPLLATYKPMLQMLWRNGLFGDADSRYFCLVDRTEGTRNLFAPDAITKDYESFASFQQVFNARPDMPLMNRMLHFDMTCSLPALLQVEDRASMASGLESRVPLLDHRIVEFMNTLPVSVKFAHGEMKRVFKEAIRPHVPKPILERTDKMGFPMPIDQWYKGSARDFVQDTLLSQRARERGIYDMSALAQVADGTGKFSRVLWGMLCLEHWHRQFIDGDANLRPAV